jgi:DNA-binding response OmpR family regulator
MKQVLIVEDDRDLTGLLTIHLEDLDSRVKVVHDGKEGFDEAMNSKYDLIILDLMLPSMDGIEVCQKLRAFDNYTPVLMLTARAEEFDKVLGLESGADDYLTKPFGVREFIARAKAILRRQERMNKEQKAEGNLKVIRLDKLEIELEKRKVLLDNEKIELTPKEFDLLVLLASHPGLSYSRDQLLSAVWGYEFNGYEHTVNSHINRLRAKIEPDINNPKYILTTWGIGYRFNDEL